MKVSEMFALFEERKAIGGYPPVVEQCVVPEMLREYEENLKKTISLLSVLKEHTVINEMANHGNNA